jgi:hypothetical protein
VKNWQSTRHNQDSDESSSDDGSENLESFFKKKPLYSDPEDDEANAVFSSEDGSINDN